MGRVLHHFFASWRFPVAALTLLVSYKLLLLVMLLAKVGDSAFGQFAEEFKTWCFGYDPATGHQEPILVVMMLTEPLVLGGLIALVWWGQLREALRAPAQTKWVVAASTGVVIAAAFAMATLRTPSQKGELPFPAQELRTSFEAPSFTLTDQDGRKVSLEDARGKVVILTGVYATCGYTCPMILRQAKAAVAELTEDERAQVAVLAITLDPARDTPEAMARMAEGQKVSSPLFRLLSGEPTQVNALLDRLGIERRRDPKTGVIDHSNLFLVVDRHGRIAYRFTLGERQRQWLTRSLQSLLREPGVI